MDKLNLFEPKNTFSKICLKRLYLYTARFIILNGKVIKTCVQVLQKVFFEQSSLFPLDSSLIEKEEGVVKLALEDSNYETDAMSSNLFLS